MKMTMSDTHHGIGDGTVTSGTNDFLLQRGYLGLRTLFEV